jgi:threonine/homoserine/homoserine lactone efflux protein
MTFLRVIGLFLAGIVILIFAGIIISVVLMAGGMIAMVLVPILIAGFIYFIYLVLKADRENDKLNKPPS